MVKLIINPNAGKGYCKKVTPQVLEFMESFYSDYEVSYTTGPKDATEIARQAVEAGVKEIVTLGGDGTALEALQGIYGHDMLFSAFPGGTGNDLIRSLGFSSNMDEFLQQFRQRREAKIDIPVSEEGPFFSSCGFGFTIEVLRMVNQKQQALIGGAILYPIVALQEIMRLRSYDLEMIIDDKVINTDVMLAVVHNAPFAGGGMKFIPHCRVDDGLLHVMLVDKISRLELIRVLPLVYSGKHINHPAVKLYSGKTVTFKSSGSHATGYDGNIYGHLPVTYRIMPKSQRVSIGPDFEKVGR